MLTMIPFLLAEILTATWFFVIGASLGSFLNVVIYRLPLGMTLLGQSLCPRCRTPISMRDNVPIISWFRLRGRCRHCDCQISSRYWMVELAVGLLVLSLALVEIAAGGINLPIRPAFHWGFAFNLFGIRSDLFVWTFVHATLLITLLATALIEVDGHRPPWLVVICVLLFLIVVASVFPGAQPRATMYPGQPESMLQPVAYGLLAAAVGLFLGWAIANATRCRSPIRRNQHFAVSMALCGMALGVAPLVGITLLALPLAGRLGSGAIGMAAAFHIFLWRPLQVVEFAGNPNRSVFVFILAVTAATAVWGRLRQLLAPRFCLSFIHKCERDKPPLPR